ncbi:MAG TPA: ATP-binding protein [Candidatus Ozemobacteraceae bacterium]|nr:ATP-binding protein [Candidatus Ozemobacteraceae bacterium]
MDEELKKRIDFLESRIQQLEKERLQSEACHVEKTGLFAGGIAHHLNNILTGIYGGLSLAGSSLNHPEQLARYLDSAQKAAGKAGELTTQLALLARRDIPDGRPVSLEKYLPETLSRAAEEYRGVKMDFSIEAGIPPVLLDLVQVQQVFQHIVKNSVQAMHENGTIKVSASLITKTGPEWGAEAPKAGHRWVELVFKDDGPGIPSELMDRIFEPHVSTRTHGTGLGLPVSKAVIQRHGGHLIVRSVPGLGAQVRILLPLCENKRECIKPAPASFSGKALVVSGDVIRGDMLMDKIIAFGFDAAKARTAEEALECCKEASALKGMYRIVFLDSGLLGMSDRAVFVDALKRQSPAPCIMMVCSPETASTTTNPGSMNEGTLVFPGKPEELQSAIAAVLAAHQGC